MTSTPPLPSLGPASAAPILAWGYTGAFFLPAPIHALIEPLTGALDAYLAHVPPGTLRWQAIGAGTEDWRPVGAATRAKCADQLRPDAARKRDLTSIELRSGDGADEASQWAVTIIGNPRDDELPDESTLFEMTLPARTYDAEEAEAAARLFMALALALPYRSAYFSPALLWSPLLADDALTRARGIAMRLPGLDISHNVVARSFLGRRIRGARWITLLDGELTAAAGGIAVLRNTSGGSFDVVAFRDGVALRAGAAPALAARDQPGFGALQKMARALEAITATDEAALPATEFAPDDDDDFVGRWERRFLA